MCHTSSSNLCCIICLLENGVSRRQTLNRCRKLSQSFCPGVEFKLILISTHEEMRSAHALDELRNLKEDLANVTRRPLNYRIKCCVVGVAYLSRHIDHIDGINPGSFMTVLSTLFLILSLLKIRQNFLHNELFWTRTVYIDSSIFMVLNVLERCNTLRHLEMRIPKVIDLHKSLRPRSSTSG